MPPAPIDPSTPRHAIVAVDMALSGQTQGDAPRSQRSWIFRLSHPKALAEIEACVAHLRDETGGGSWMWTGEGGTPIHVVFPIAPRRSLGGQLPATDPLAGCPDAFAALSAWGCGPLAGLRRMGVLFQLDGPALDADLRRFLIEEGLALGNPAPPGRAAPRL